MTDKEYLIREQMAMSAFTFYLDNLTKLKVIKKLKELGIDEKKGAISATIRTLMNMFAENKFDNLINSLDIKKEYSFTTKRNKRSTL